MPLSDAQYKSLVISQVGDDTAGTLAGLIDTLWTANDAQLTTHGQFLSTKRDAIDVMLARVRSQVDFSDPLGISPKLSQLFSNLLKMRGEVQAMIDGGGGEAIVEEDSSYAAAAGELSTTSSLPQPTAGLPDGNSPTYSGYLYGPRRRRP